MGFAFVASASGGASGLLGAAGTGSPFGVAAGDVGAGVLGVGFVGDIPAVAACEELAGAGVPGVISDPDFSLETGASSGLEADSVLAEESVFFVSEVSASSSDSAAVASVFAATLGGDFSAPRWLRK